MLSTQLRIRIYPVTLCHVEYSCVLMVSYVLLLPHSVAPCTMHCEFFTTYQDLLSPLLTALGLYRPPSQALLEKSSPSIIPLFKVHSKRMISMLEILFWSERSGGIPCSGPLVGFLSIYYKETKLTLKLEKCFSLTRGKTGCC